MSTVSPNRRHGGRWVLFVLALGPSLPAAASSPWYVGVSWSEVTPDPDMNVVYAPGFVDVSTEHGFKALAGWKVRDWLAVEAAYLDLGSQDGTFLSTCPGPGCPLRVEREARALSLTALGSVRAGPVDFFLRAGVAHVDHERRREAAFVEPDLVSTSDSRLTYGAGMQLRLRRFAFRAEYEFLDANVHKFDVVSLGLTWSFR